MDIDEDKDIDIDINIDVDRKTKNRCIAIAIGSMVAKRYHVVMQPNRMARPEIRPKLAL